MTEQEKPNYSVTIKGNLGTYDSIEAWQKAEGGIVSQQAARIKELEAELEIAKTPADGLWKMVFDLRQELILTQKAEKVAYEAGFNDAKSTKG
jgi:hypothetical protein